MHSIKDSLVSTLKHIEERTKHRRTGISSGFTGFDRMTGGFHVGKVTVISGRRTDATALLDLQISMLLHIAERGDVPVYWYPGIGEEAACMRLLSNAAELPIGVLEHGALDRNGWAHLAVQLVKVHAMPITIMNDEDIMELREERNTAGAQISKGLLVLNGLPKSMAMNSDSSAVLKRAANDHTVIFCSILDDDNNVSHELLSNAKNEYHASMVIAFERAVIDRRPSMNCILTLHVIENGYIGTGFIELHYDEVCCAVKDI